MNPSYETLASGARPTWTRPKRQPLAHSSSPEGMIYLVDDEFMRELQEEFRCRRSWYVLMEMFVVDNANRKEFIFSHSSRFEVVYRYFNPENKQTFWIIYAKDSVQGILGPKHEIVTADDYFISLGEYSEHYIWPELEGQEFFAVPFGRHRRPKLFLGEKNPPLLQKQIEPPKWPVQIEHSDPLFEPLLRMGEDVQAKRAVVHYDPAGPFYTDRVGLHVDLIDTKMAQVALQVGHNFSGFEKKAERLPVHSTVALCQSLNSLSPATNAITWCMSVEQAFGWEIPQKAMAMRMIYLELDRIRDHSAYLAKIFTVMKEDSCHGLAMDCFREIESLYLQSEGQPNICTNLALGGVLREFALEYSSSCQRSLKRIQDRIVLLQKFISGHPKFVELNHKAQLGTAHVMKWFVTGPNARASGFNLDWRRDNPYYFYQDVEFDIPLGAEGGIYDRMLIRLAEMTQSIHILFQILDNLPAGSTMILDPRCNFSLLKEMSKEHSFKELLSIPIPKGYWGKTIEAPNGTLHCSLVSDGNALPYRVHWSGASYNFLALVRELLLGMDVSELDLVVSSIGAVVSEIDR